MFKINSILLFSLCFSLSGCFSENPKENGTGNTAVKKTANKNLRLEAAPISSDSSFLKMELGPFIYDAFELKFILQDAVLGTASPGHENQKGRVSELGTYLHIVLNDTIHIRNSYRLVPHKLPDGNYRMLAFVSRSYDETVKLLGASFSRNFEVKSGRTVKSFPLDDALLALNAPYGDYTVESAVLLDFCLHNTELSASSNKVRILIDAKNEFFINEWKPFYIRGLGLGEHSVEIELQNSMGQRIYGPVKGEFRVLEK